MTTSAAVLSTATRAARTPSFTTLVGKTQPRRTASSGESALLATVAHELRNPLTSLRLSLDALVTDYDQLSPETTMRMLQRAQRSAAFLSGIVENLTNSAAVKAGQLKVCPTTIDIRECIDEAIGLVQALLAQRGQSARLHTSLDATLVVGDRARIVQVLANLLSNACRYSVQGDVIEVHLTATAHHTRVRVTDHGPGISPRDQQRIFSAWQRGESAAPGGLGLGLSIVQNIVQQLGGRVGVESTLGEGATFWFTVPNAS